jgi:hypothetical protein
MEREIYNRIFPHLENEGDYGYPFNSREELRKLCHDSELESTPFVQEIETDIVRMPKAYGEAFRYILYRNLKTHGTMPSAYMRMFRMLARRRVHPKTCDPRFVARHA